MSRDHTHRTRCSRRVPRRTYDAAICMYHDQALIPLKTLDVDAGGQHYHRLAIRAHVLGPRYGAGHHRAWGSGPGQPHLRDQDGRQDGGTSFTGLGRPGRIRCTAIPILISCAQG
jgi:hypothetical protein